MLVERFRVTNFKSFADSGEIHLERGFNVIVGRNNVGKTALAEAMSLRFQDKPHRSTKTVPKPGLQPSPGSQAEVSIRLDAEELVDLLVSEMPTFYAPTNSNIPDLGEAPFRAMLSEGVTVDAVIRNAAQFSSQLSAYDSFPGLSSAYLRYVIDTSGEARGRGLFFAVRLPGVDSGSNGNGSRAAIQL